MYLKLCYWLYQTIYRVIEKKTRYYLLVSHLLVRGTIGPIQVPLQSVLYLQKALRLMSIADPNGMRANASHLPAMI